MAAITIPSLVNNSGKHKYEVGIKKFYSNMSNAIRKYMADEGVDDLRNSKLGSNDEDIRQEALNDFVRKYFNVTKECNNSNGDECFSSKFKNLYGDVNYAAGILYGDNAFVLSDGSVLALMPYGGGPIFITVDINGKKKPNIMGYDIWNTDIYFDGSIDEASPEDKEVGRAHNRRQSRFESACLGEGTYGGCFGHLLENGFKIDY